ncbi:MAG: hypothetical protein ACTTKF_04110 [Bacteroides sp.]
MQHPLPSWRSVRFERYSARRAALVINRLPFPRPSSITGGAP